MEARNFITAREMITDGNWLLTTMNGEPRYQKPPLPTWLAAISAMTFGIKSLYAMRLPGFLMVIVIALYSFILSNSMLKNKHQSLINALIILTSFYIIGIVIEAPWDIFTHGFMLIGIYHLYQFFEKSNNYWKHVIFAMICIGFSIMCKGPVSIYALLLPFLIAYGFTYKYNSLKAKWFSVFTILIIGLVIGGWWYLYVRFVDPETFIAITKKETGNWSSYNVRPFYYYWSFFIQSGLWTIPAFVSLIYPYLKTRASNLKAYKFTLLWTIIAVILLSIIPEKKSRYLMPVLIPLALNTGFYIEYLIRKFKDLTDKRETIPVYFNFGIIGLIGLTFPIVGYLFLKNIMTSGWMQFGFASIVLFLIGILILRAMFKKQIKMAFYLCIALMASVFIFIIPLTKHLKNENYSSLKSLKSDLDNNGFKLYSFGTPSPEIIWDYGGTIEVITENNINSLLNKKKVDIIIQEGNNNTIENLQKQYQLEFIKTYNLNTVSENKRGYKNRLTYEHYKITSK